MRREAIETAVRKALRAQAVTDLHTHCYSPRFGASPEPGGMLLWGIDELVTYHYLIAEVFRVVPATRLPYERFWEMSKTVQADHIWRQLFVERTPISEACRGVLTTLQRLGLDPNEKDLARYRKWFAAQEADAYVDRVMELANVDSITMTNPVFDEQERALWLKRGGLADDPRFPAVLRIDPLLRDWPQAAGKLADWGYRVAPDFSGETVAEARRFLEEWLDRMKAIYVAVSLPPEFRYPSRESPERDRALAEIILPVLEARSLPFAMMIGSRLRVNPGLRDGGDMSGKADIASLASICRDFPQNRFLVTLLARENQHELCVAARKFGNLMVFGCWWFVNNPSLVDEITRMRLELLGTSFIPQHSDARILDQLLYKWEHSREALAPPLVDKYADLAATGWRVTAEIIARDVRLLLRDNFRAFVGGK